MRHVWTILRTAQHAPASGGGNGALRLDGPVAGQFSAQPDRPCGPPLSPRLRRGSPCGSIRARGARNMRGWSRTALACREGAYGRTVVVARASPIGARQAKGKTSRGAGGRLRNAGHRAGAVHALAGWAAQPSTGGRGSGDSSSTTPVCESRTSLKQPNCCGRDSRESFSAEHRSILISNVQKSCRSLVRRRCRTRGGLAVLGRNTDMRRHGVLRPKTDEPQPLRGRGA
jgi:hypothetical protein